MRKGPVAPSLGRELIATNARQKLDESVVTTYFNPY